VAREKAFSELSKKEKLAWARSAQRKASEIIEGPTRSQSKTERAGAFNARAAARRVEARLTGKEPSYTNDAEVSNPSKPGKPSRERKRKASKPLPTSKRKAPNLRDVANRTKEEADRVKRAKGIADLQDASSKN